MSTAARLFNLTQINNNQEQNYRNRLIEIFGYPYSGDIGTGGTYSAGYDGPDLLHFMYVDVPALTGEKIEENQREIKVTLNWPEEYDGIIPSQQIRNEPGDFAISYFINDKSSWLSAKPEWSNRKASGEIQFALSDLIKSEVSYNKALTEFNKILGKIEKGEALAKSKWDSNEDKITYFDTATRNIQTYRTWVARSKGTAMGAEALREYIQDNAKVLIEKLPKSVGMAPDVFGTVRSVLTKVKTTLKYAAAAVQIGALISAGVNEGKIADEADLLKRKLMFEDMRNEMIPLANELELLSYDLTAKQQELMLLTEVINQNHERYLAAQAKGLRLLDELQVFRRQQAAKIQDYRYRDMALRLYRNQSLQQYQAAFDLASRYAYMAATAYDYETNLLGSDSGTGQQFFTNIIRQRSLGGISNGAPVVGEQGLGDVLGKLSQNFSVYKTQLGFNNPQTETNRFSLRTEALRIPAGDSTSQWTPYWKEQLKRYQVENLWEDENFRRYCRPFINESAGAQPALVIPFSTQVNFGYNFFGRSLASGDSAYDPTNFATKIRSVGVWFSNYQTAGLSNTPRIYLIPVGEDVLRSPTGSGLQTRHWKVVDQAIPVPFSLGAADLGNPDWLPSVDSLSGEIEAIRKFSSFRAYHDSGSFNTSETISNNRLIGRSVWNTRWLLIVPGGTLLADPAQGINNFIDNITDIKLFFQTYAYSGN